MACTLPTCRKWDCVLVLYLRGFILICDSSLIFNFFLEYPSGPGEWMILMVGCTAWSGPVPSGTFPWKSWETGLYLEPSYSED